MADRVIRDRAGDLWVVEECGGGEGHALRCRHELGYELVIAAPRPLSELDERTLVSALEAERRRPPRAATPAVASAAA